MNTGEVIINEIIKQNMINVIPDNCGNYIFKWSGNAEEQLSAVVDSFIKEKENRSWLPAKDAPKRETVIVGGFGKTGSGRHDGAGNWFVYGSNIRMETPTHYMEYPHPPSANL